MGMGMGMGMGGMMNVNIEAAKEFNANDRKKSDTLVDISILARYKLSSSESFELGIARKNRAPNLYERYSWGMSTMATTMIGWFGDGNGYVGDPNLTAETAHTFSVSYNKGVEDKDLQWGINFWYTKVSDYIDAQTINSFNNGTTDISQRNILQFTNIDASLYGAKLKASYHITDSTSLGKIALAFKLNSTRGQQDNTSRSLYQIKPLQTELALQQQLGNWQNSIVWQWLDEKERVDYQRLENKTNSYHLVNLNSQTSVGNFDVTLSITNLLDKYYQMPLGGVSVAQYKQNANLGYQQLAGEGRSFNFGVNYKF